MTAHAMPVAGPKRQVAGPNAFVRRLADLVPLTADELVALSRMTFPSRIVAADVDVIEPGTRIEHAFVVLDGFACRYKLRQNGKRQNLGFLLPGDVSDFDAVILGGAPQAIATLTPCTIVQVPAADLVDLVENHPSLARAFRRAKLVDEAITREWLMGLGCYSASERIARFFCEMLVRLQTVDLAHDNSFDYPLTQNDLGNALGMSSVHINRSLQYLRQQGWITLRSGRLRIRDLERLKEHGEFEADYLQAGE